MARHGNSRHLNRLAASTYARVSRKTTKYLAKPMPGRHALSRSIALYVVVRDKLGFAANANEARKAIKTGGIMVNGRRVSNDRYPVGLGDTVTLVQSKETYTVGVGKGGDIKVEKAGEKAQRTLKVIGKYLSRGSKPMLRLYDGSTVQAAKETRVNDSVVLDSSKVKSVIKLENGARCIVIKGTHASETGVVKEIKKGGATSVAAVKIEGQAGTFETPIENVMAIGA